MGEKRKRRRSYPEYKETGPDTDWALLGFTLLALAVVVAVVVSLLWG